MQNIFKRQNLQGPGSNTAGDKKSSPKTVRIGVMGLGGAGGNALEHMYALSGADNITFYACNTDVQALDKASCNKIILGQKLTRGLGSGGDPNIGRESAIECAEELQNVISQFDIVFFAAGLGGGTGTGSIEVCCEIARSLDVLAICVCTLPFKIERNLRTSVALKCRERLNNLADLNIVVPNDNLKKHLGSDATLLEAFRAANDILANAVETVSSLVQDNGLVNVDFNDIRTVVKDMGRGIITYSAAKGDLRAKNAIHNAIHNPVLEAVDLCHASSAIVHITASIDLTLGEYEEIGGYLEGCMREDANVIIGTTIDPTMEALLGISLIVTGFDDQKQQSKISNEKENDDYKKSSSKEKFLI